MVIGNSKNKSGMCFAGHPVRIVARKKTLKKGFKKLMENSIKVEGGGLRRTNFTLKLLKLPRYYLKTNLLSTSRHINNLTQPYIAFHKKGFKTPPTHPNS